MAEARNLSEYEKNQPDSYIKLVPSSNSAKKPKAHIPRKRTWLYTIGYVVMGLLSLTLIFTTIDVENRITSVSNSIVKEQYQKADKEEEIGNLKQEKNELSRVDRIMEIAKKGGLTVNDGNIRKVSP